MQCFRLMGMPDKVIAFDELPARLLSGFDMCRMDGFPRHWKEWVGKTERKIIITPERDLLTGQIRKFEPIIENDYFFYILDWMNNPQVEKWIEIVDFVKAHVPKEFRIMERIELMAKSLAANKSDGVTLEPEEVTIIPIPLEYQEKTKGILTAEGEEVKPKAEIKPKKEKIVLKCDLCDYEAEGSYAKNSLRFHKSKKHPIPTTENVPVTV